MQNWKQYIQLIGYKAYSDLLAEVSRGSLGLLWWVLEPMAYLGAFYVIFEMALKRGGEGFVPFLLTGLVTWKWFVSSISTSANALTAARGLITQVYIPKVLLPAAIVCGTTFKFVIIFSLLLLFLIIYGYPISVFWIAIPLIVALQFLLILGGSILVSAVVPVLPDLKLIIENLLLLLFFLSGILFDLSQLSGTTVGTVLSFNPVAILIESYRNILLDQQWPIWGDCMYVLTFALLTLGIGLMIHNKLDRVYAKFI